MQEKRSFEKPKVFKLEPDLEFWSNSTDLVLEGYLEKERESNTQVKVPFDMQLVQGMIKGFLTQEKGISREKVIQEIKNTLKIVISRNGVNPQLVINRMWMLISPIGITSDEVIDDELPEAYNTQLELLARKNTEFVSR